MQNNEVKNRKTLIITLLMFILPVVIGTTMFMTGWRPSATVNHGELIVPVRALAERELQSIEGKTVKIADLRKKWTMVYFDTSACPDECTRQLFFMRQIHLGLGKDYDRMQRVFVLNDAGSVDSLKPRLAEYPDMLVVKSDAANILSMRKEFGADTDAAARYIYLVDPMGNLMMQYKPGSEPAGVRKDLERLLKYSGDKQ